jgi:hypothetical protein
MTIDSALFHETFGTPHAAGSASLVSFLDPISAIRSRRVCKSMRDIVEVHLTCEQIEWLAERIRTLSLERSFSLCDAPSPCKRDHRFVEYAVRRNALNYLDASENVRGNPLIMKTALTSAKLFNPSDLATLLDAFGGKIARGPIMQKLLQTTTRLESHENTKKFWVDWGYAAIDLTCASRESPYIRDKDIVLSMVQQSGYMLLFTHADLRTDRDIVMAAVRQYGLALLFAHSDLKADGEIVMTAVRQNGLALEAAHQDLQANRQIVMAAVQQDGRALQFAHMDLQADREIVMAAVKQSGPALQFAQIDLKADREIVLAAVNQRGFALQFAHGDLQADKEIVMTAVKQNGLALEFAPLDLRADRNIVMAAIKQNKLAYEFAHPFLKKDREILSAIGDHSKRKSTSSAPNPKRRHK